MLVIHPYPLTRGGREDMHRPGIIRHGETRATPEFREFINRKFTRGIDSAGAGTQLPVVLAFRFRTDPHGRDTGVTETTTERRKIRPAFLRPRGAGSGVQEREVPGRELFVIAPLPHT